MTTRKELRALQRKVDRVMPQLQQEVCVFIKETAVDKDALCNNPYDVYFDKEGKPFHLSNIRELEKQGIECICVIPVKELPFERDLSKLTDEELDQLETILEKVQ